MKQMKKLGIVGISIVAAASTYYVINQYNEKPIHFHRAVESLELTKNWCEFECQKNRIAHYYLSGVYDADLEKICAQAEHFFSTIPVQQNSLIIFDVDDTALYHIQTFKKFEFIWSHKPELKNVGPHDQAPALKPVLELYKFLSERGFKFIFLTGRNEKHREQTLRELRHEGYTDFEQLILMPNNLKLLDSAILAGDWKLSVRKKLACTYDIVGNVGDREIDFFGGCNGHKVKLPNYLY